jgi:hypothetical protein
VIEKRVVVISETISINIADECFTEDWLDEFEKCFFTLDEKSTRKESLISHACFCLVNGSDIDFIEGIGQVVHSDKYYVNPSAYKDVKAIYDIYDQVVEVN